MDEMNNGAAPQDGAEDTQMNQGEEATNEAAPAAPEGEGENNEEAAA